MPTLARTPPPSGLLTSAPTPPPRLLSLRPLLAGLAVLALGVPIVFVLPGSARQAAVRAASPPAVRPARPAPAGSAHPATGEHAAATPGISATPVGGPAIRPTPGPIILVPKTAARPTGSSPTPDRKSRRPSHAHPTAAAQPSPWVRAECTRRYAHDPLRRSACVSLLTAALAH